MNVAPHDLLQKAADKQLLSSFHPIRSEHHRQPHHYLVKLLYMPAVTVDVEFFFSQGTEFPDFVIVPADDDGKQKCFVDYGWLSNGAPPSWDATNPESFCDLAKWMLGNIKKANADRLALVAQSNERFAFEYAVSFSHLGDSASFFVSPDGNRISIMLPLFTDNSSSIYRRLENGLMLYEKCMSYPLLGEQELKDIVRSTDSPTLEFHYYCTLVLKGAGPSEPFSVASEQVIVADVVKERREIVHLLELIDLLSGLPKLQDAVKNGQGFIDFLPMLEDSLNGTKLEEMIHWLEMVMALTSYFGEPSDMNPFVRDGRTTAKMRRHASFVVTDSGSNMSVIISVQYEGMSALPIVEISTAHHCFSTSSGEPIRIRATFGTDVGKLVSTPTRPRSHLDVVLVADSVNMFLEQKFAKFQKVCTENSRKL